MTSRLALLLGAFALVVAACGVDRGDGIDDAAEVVSDETTALDDTTDDGAAGDTTETTATPTTAAPTPTEPPTTAPAEDVAATLLFNDGETTELLHGTLNDIVVPSLGNQEFVDLVYQGAVPPSFDAVVLSQSVIGQALDNELAQAGATTTPENLDEARTQLLGQLETLFVGQTDPTAEAERLLDEVPYLGFITELQARQIALSSTLAAGAGDAEGDPCVRHILLEAEADADDVLAELEGGADFAELAAERSTGPTGPNGGDLGCGPATNYVAEFADAVTEAEVGAFIGPVETQFGFHVILVEGYEVDGDSLAQTALTEGLNEATVTVDERVGTWDASRLTIIPVGS